MDANELKMHTSRLYDLCSKLYADEFPSMFIAPREKFRDWLNEKTGLNEDHMRDKNNAIKNWVDVLEVIAKN